MKSAVLDRYALIPCLDREEGYEEVAKLLDNRALLLV